MFTDINTGIVKDSFQIEGKQHDPQSLISYGREFTPDGRYFNFSSHWSLDNNGPIFFQIYDRQTREIIFKRETPAGSNFRYQYFNTSNKIAFAEEVKLTGDDKVYSYIRIFDPDTRTIVKDIKLSEFENDGFRIDLSDKFIVYQLGDLNNPNIKKLYNLETDKFINFDFRTGGGTGLVLVDLPYIYSYGIGLAGERIDMSVRVVENMEKEVLEIYPNPTNGIVSLNITPEYLMGKWNVSDMQGRILKKGLIGHTNILEINIEDLVPGTYYVTVIGTGNKQSHKIIRI